MSAPGRQESAKGATDSKPDQGVIRLQAVCREINERVAKMSGDSQITGPLVFLCECGCAEKVQLTLGRYQAVRRLPPSPLLKPGHAEPEPDRIIEGAYVLTEALGVLGVAPMKLNAQLGRPKQSRRDSQPPATREPEHVSGRAVERDLRACLLR